MQQTSDKSATKKNMNGPSVGSPISNEAYNVISALHAKLEGLEAYRKYAKDSDQNLWARLTRTEVENVTVLVDELEKLVRNGELRVDPSRNANAE